MILCPSSDKGTIAVRLSTLAAGTNHKHLDANQKLNPMPDLWHDGCYHASKK
ncbi:hypothetical protein GGD67_002891 [Bradyrhizobium sp. IAR9]|nr:hypothetical protein [Bradyrhizobium sp. IAR9]